MHRSTFRSPRVLGAALAVLGLGAALATTDVVTPAPSAEAASTVAVERTRGGDRYETARLVAHRAFPTGAIHAVLARGDLFPDALAGSRLAGTNPSPILLTTSDHLHPQAAAALAELGVSKVHLLGGSTAISDDVRDELVALGYQVDRFGGLDRFETAAIVARSGPVGSAPGHGRTAIVASGIAFPDALAGGPVSYDRQFPILLTHPAALPAVTTSALADLAIEHVLLLGGPAAVATTVQADIEAMGISVERLAGPDRYATAAAIAAYEHAVLGWPLDEQVLATGLDFPDAVIAGPLAGERTGSILLTDDGLGGDGLPAASAAACAAVPAFSTLHVVGSAPADVPHLATQSCRILGEGDGAMAWMFGDQPSTPAYTPALVYQHTNVATISTVVRLGKGLYQANPTKVGRGDGSVQVTSYDPNRYCKTEWWGPASALVDDDLQVVIQCRDLSGTPADARWTLQYVLPPVGVGPVGLAHVWDPTVPGELPDNHNYNSSGGVNSFDKPADGRFVVRFPGLVGGGGTARVTAVGTDDARCTVVAWGDSGAGADVEVACVRPDGTPANTPFTVVFGYAAIAPVGATQVAWVWAGDETNPAYTPNPTYQYTSAGTTVTVQRPSVGEYDVTLPGLATAGGNPQVVAYGDTANHCYVYWWAPVAADEVVTVRCEDRFGHPVDERFVLQFVS